MSIREAVSLIVAIVVAACAPATTHSHYKISASLTNDEGVVDPWVEAFTRLYQVYLAGDCGDQPPTLRDSEIHTSACGREPEEMRAALGEWPGLSYSIEGIDAAEYEAAIERNKPPTTIISPN